MPEYEVTRSEGFNKCVEQFCSGLEGFDEVLEELIWETTRNPKLFAHRLSPEWPQYSRPIGGEGVPWECQVLYTIDEQARNVTLIGCWPRTGPPREEELD